MAKQEPLKLLDPRELAIDISPGGTTKPFLSEALPRGGTRVVVMDDVGNTAEIKVRYEVDSLFEVTYGSGLRAVYDYLGNLIRVEFGLAAYMNALPEEVLGQFTEDAQESAGMLLETGTDINVEVDLADGLAAGDRRGWVQVVPSEGAYRLDESIGGWEVVDGELAATRKIDVGTEEDVVGSLGVRVESKDDSLAVGVGDIYRAATFRLRRFVNTDLLAHLKTPRGTYRLLQQMRP
jgi:hypothetical protein